MSAAIQLGYELGTGKAVKIPLNHMAILGQTQLSGKTTTMEAVAVRAGVRVIAFITKPGEKSFRLKNPIPAFFSEAATEEYWKHVVAILEYRGESRLGWRERGMVIKLCQDYEKQSSRIGMPDKKGKSKREAVKYEWEAPRSLADLLKNIETYLPFANRGEEMICIQLREYLQPAIREIEKTKFSTKLELAQGINVMDVTDLSDGLKALVIRSVIEHVHKKMRKTVVIVPEAWKFIPEGRDTPVKLALEGLIREGAGVENFVWMDSQDLRGVDKKLLRSVIVWLFGVQRQRNEVSNTLDSIPDHPKPTSTEVMQLGKGQFIVSFGNTLVRAYVQPAGMEDAHAQAIATGVERAESWSQIVQHLDKKDEAMWKEKFDELKANYDRLAEGAAQREIEFEQLREARDLMAKRLEACDVYLKQMEIDRARDFLDPSRESIDSKTSATPPVADPTAEALQGKGPSSRPTTEVSAVPSNGNKVFKLDQATREEIYSYVKDRAACDPGVLQILRNLPDIVVKVERKTIDLNADTLRGMLAVLISEKFFDAPKNGNQAFQEVQRRGRRTAKPNVYRELDGLAELGFLTKEDGGYQVVSSMKVNIVEAQ